MSNIDDEVELTLSTNDLNPLTRALSNVTKRFLESDVPPMTMKMSSLTR